MECILGYVIVIFFKISQIWKPFFERLLCNETLSGVIWQFDIPFLKSKDDNAMQVAATGRSTKCQWPKLAHCLSQSVLQSVNDAS